MRKLLASILATVVGTLALQAQKPALDHSVYDDWKSLSRASVPWDGAWMYYTVSPQQGDGVLTVRNALDGREWTCPRATDFKISADGTKAVYKIKPAYQQTRQARIKKKKPDPCNDRSAPRYPPAHDTPRNRCRRNNLFQRDRSV